MKRGIQRTLAGLQAIEAVNELRSLGLGAFSHYVRYGIRALVATPRFTTAALLTIDRQERRNAVDGPTAKRLQGNATFKVYKALPFSLHWRSNHSGTMNGNSHV
jgi:hypothetical protein